MRHAALILLVLAFAAPLAPAAATRPSGGSISVEGGRGTIVIKGRGDLRARIDRGIVAITDLTPFDQWSPRVNGVPRGRAVSIRGQRISVYIPDGRYKIQIRGEGISISGYGTGTVMLDGEPDASGATGSYAIGDAERHPLPADPTRLSFGQAEQTSAASARIAP